MIIESKFHDFYDPLAKRFRDKSIVYQRHESFVRDKLPKELPNSPINRGNGLKQDVHYLIFCGQLYPLVHVHQSYWVSENNKEINYYDYDINLVRNVIGSKWETWDAKIQNKLNEALDFDWTEFCLKHYSPVIKILPTNSNNLQLNPSLKEIEFFKISDINQTYQRLAQFMGMVFTTPEKSPRPIEDKLKAKNHGFDKWSFRKDTPPTRKQK